MKLDQTFTVLAPPATVWEALIDVARVAPCLPGAAITGDDGQGSYQGEFKVKLGPTTAAYNGHLKMESVDQDARVATMSAKGTDKRGAGGATASIVSSVHQDGGTTRVDVSTDFSITGRLARFGRGGMVQDVANRLLREFAANLQDELSGDGTLEAGAGDPAGVGGTSAPAPAGDAGAAAGLAGGGLAGGAGGAPAPDPEAVPGTTGPSSSGSSGQGTSTPPKASAPKPPRPPAEPLDGGGLAAGAAKDAAARQPLAVFLLGVVVGLLLRRARG